jgi:hypothetical protein
LYFWQRAFIITATGRRLTRVLRGGAWNNQPDNMVCAYRNNNQPDNRNNNLGFRCAKTPLRRAVKAHFPGIINFCWATGRSKFYWIFWKTSPMPITVKINWQNCSGPTSAWKSSAAFWQFAPG